jgi:hypothetical protein
LLRDLFLLLFLESCFLKERCSIRQGNLVGSELDFSKITFFQKELFSLHTEIPHKTATSKLSTVKPSSSSCIMKEDNQVGV